MTRTIWLSIDPYMRGRLREEQTYAVAIQIGEVMTGEAVGEVIASNHPGFTVGDIAVGPRGWQTHNLSKGDNLVKIERHGAPLSAYLGVLGMPGATAYAGITEICKPKAGETVEIRAFDGVYVDGVKLDEPYEKDTPDYSFGPLEVPAGDVFVLGDNRRDSSDSHIWGPLDTSRIVGRAWISLAPLDDFGMLPHPSYAGVEH